MTVPEVQILVLREALQGKDEGFGFSRNSLGSDSLSYWGSIAEFNRIGHWSSSSSTEGGSCWATVVLPVLFLHQPVLAFFFIVSSSTTMGCGRCLLG